LTDCRRLCVCLWNADCKTWLISLGGAAATFERGTCDAFSCLRVCVACSSRLFGCAYLQGCGMHACLAVLLLACDLIALVIVWLCWCVFVVDEGSFASCCARVQGHHWY
jgi:hypothetical protein